MGSQHDLQRKPRVHIEYKVQTGKSTKKVSLPFVMGVLADLSGEPAEALPDLSDRAFTDINADSFDGVLKKQKPRVTMQVPDKLSGEQGQNLSIELTFEEMKDFEPDRIAERVEPLKALLAQRKDLQTLLRYLDGRGEAEKKLKEMLDQAKPKA